MSSGLISDFTRELLLLDTGNTLPPGERSVSEAGTGIDLDGTEVNFGLLFVGAASGTSPSLIVSLEGCDTVDGVYQAIRRPDGSPGTAIVFPTVSTGFHALIVTFRRTRRFARAVATISGGSFVCGIVISGQKRNF